MHASLRPELVVLSRRRSGCSFDHLESCWENRDFWTRSFSEIYLEILPSLTIEWKGSVLQIHSEPCVHLVLSGDSLSLLPER